MVALTPSLIHPPSTQDEHLPPFDSPFFKWGNVDGAIFKEAIVSAYNEVVHWKRNVFKVPSGKVGKAFVFELAHLFNAYDEASTLESVVANDPHLFRC